MENIEKEQNELQIEPQETLSFQNSDSVKEDDSTETENIEWKGGTIPVVGTQWIVVVNTRDKEPYYYDRITVCIFLKIIPFI